MKILSKPYGEVEISEENIITIQGGLFGFEGLEKYVFLEPSTPGPFLWLQSLDEPALAFVVIRPEEFKYGYRLVVAKEDLEAIGLEKPEEAISLAIVVVPEDPSKMTANLQGPIILNPETKIGKQVISLHPEYTTRHYVLEEMKVLLEKVKEESETTAQTKSGE